MKFLIDAHLPRRMVGWLAAAGCDASHMLNLPRGNRTPDSGVTEIADQNDRVLVTKDGDFVNSHLLSFIVRGNSTCQASIFGRAVAENNR